jgi:hypothetical protein
MCTFTGLFVLGGRGLRPVLVPQLVVGKGRDPISPGGEVLAFLFCVSRLIARRDVLEQKPRTSCGEVRPGGRTTSFQTGNPAQKRGNIVVCGHRQSSSCCCGSYSGRTMRRVSAEHLCAGRTESRTAVVFPQRRGVRPGPNFRPDSAALSSRSARSSGLPGRVGGPGVSPTRRGDCFVDPAGALSRGGEWSRTARLHRWAPP